MISNNIRSNKQLANQKGISIIELVISVLVVAIVITSWLQLTSSSIQTGTHVEKVAVVKDFAKAKVVELAKNANSIFANMPSGVDAIGSLSPGVPITNFSDQLDFQGNSIPLPNNQAIIPKFTRQWLLVRNSPNNGDITIFCSVVYSDNNRIVRIAKSVVTDSTTITTISNNGSGSGPRH